MSSPLRASRLRLALGVLGMVAGLGVAFFLLPDASQQLAQKQRAKREAELSRNQQVQRLQELQQLADRIRRGRETLADLEWQGAYERLNDVCHRLGDEKFPGRVPRWRKS